MGLDSGRDPNSFFFKVLTLKLSQRLNKTTQRRSKLQYLFLVSQRKKIILFDFSKKPKTPLIYWQLSQVLSNSCTQMVCKIILCGNFHFQYLFSNLLISLSIESVLVIEYPRNVKIPLVPNILYMVNCYEPVTH